MFFVYRIKSTVFPEQYYTGYTRHVEKRLVDHNEGKVPHTAKYKPWALANYFAFTEEKIAKEFEKYLKLGSGRAFAKKHF